MKIALGSDHAALDEKTAVGEYLRKLGHEVADLGTQNKESCDYPDYAKAVAESVASGSAELGVLLCGTGIGVSIAANKVKGVRAALIGEPFSARMAKEHNNANVICFGARVSGLELIKASLDAYLAASFGGAGNEKHERRVGKIMAIEE